MTGVLAHHVALVGLPGAGKSTAGRLAAATLGVPFVDFDAELARRTGLSVAEHFATLGEPAFRGAEAELSRELASSTAALLAPGGGWMANAAARSALGAARTLYLRTSPAVAARRLARDPTVRPLVAAVAASADSAAAVAALLARREATYAAADATVDTDARTADEVAADIVAVVRTWATQPADACAGAAA